MRRYQKTNPTVQESNEGNRSKGGYEDGEEQQTRLTSN